MSKVGQRILTSLREAVTMAELQAEITRLRAELAAVKDERDRLRKALKPFADAVDIFIAENHDAHRAIVTLGDFFHARTVFEGVTEPVALWQHKKTGGVYEIVGECQIEATNAPGVLYRNTSTGVTWMRPKEEFFDGRFVECRKPEPSI